MKNILSLLLISFISPVLAETISIPISKTCLEKKRQTIEMMSKGLCSSITVHEFALPHEAYPNITHYVVIKKLNSENPDTIKACEDEDISKLSNIFVKRCVGLGRSTVQRTGDNEKDLETLSKILALRLKHRANELEYELKITEDIIELIEVND